MVHITAPLEEVEQYLDLIKECIPLMGLPENREKLIEFTYRIKFSIDAYMHYHDKI